MDPSSRLLWHENTWPDLRDPDRRRSVAILPTGAVEAHGPHLPLCTDPVIAEAMAEDGARRLRADGWQAWVLPSLHYTAADFAAGFPGTLSIRPETVTALVADIGRSLAAQGVATLAIANAHLDPGHLGSLHRAVEDLASVGIRVVFPDVTRKPWALRLGDEFRSGACHAGRYEGSVVMARRADLVRDGLRRSLAPVNSSLSRAIRDGKTRFEEAGGTEAYFGDPAAATAEEGHQTVATLGAIVYEAVTVPGD